MWACPTWQVVPSVRLQSCWLFHYTMKVHYSSQDIDVLLSEFKGEELRGKKQGQGQGIVLSLKSMVTVKLVTHPFNCFIFLHWKWSLSLIKMQTIPSKSCLKIFKDRDKDQNTSLTVYKLHQKHPTPASTCNYPTQSLFQTQFNLPSFS